MIEIFFKVPKFNLCPFQKAAEKRKPDPDDERELRKKVDASPDRILWEKNSSYKLDDFERKEYSSFTD